MIPAIALAALVTSHVAVVVANTRRRRPAPGLAAVHRRTPLPVTVRLADLSGRPLEPATVGRPPTDLAEYRRRRQAVSR